MTDEIKVLVSWLAPVILFSANIVWSWVLKRAMDKVVETRKQDQAAKEKKLRDEQNLSDGLKAILHDAIYTKAQGLLCQGWATPADKKNLEYLYQPYHNMGGNGTGTSLFESVLKLRSSVPIEREGE